MKTTMSGLSERVFLFLVSFVLPARRRRSDDLGSTRQPDFKTV